MIDGGDVVDDGGGGYGDGGAAQADFGSSGLVLLSLFEFPTSSSKQVS